VKEREIVTMIERGKEKGSETGKKRGSEREKKGRGKESENGRERENENGNEKELEKGIKNENVKGSGKTKTRDEMTAEKSERISEKIGIPEMDMMRENQSKNNYKFVFKSYISARIDERERVCVCVQFLSGSDCLKK
jgi:hypothetical protein